MTTNVESKPAAPSQLVDLEPEFVDLFRRVEPSATVDVATLHALYRAVRDVVADGVHGDFVECGVHRGGCCMLIALTLRACGADDRRIWLYDTFAAGLDEVREKLAATGYDAGRLVFVPGRTQDTIPNLAPERIALLRIDTEWHDSTVHEIAHLSPRLAARGVLMSDVDCR